MMNQNQAQFGGSFQQPAQQPKGCWGRNWKWMVPAGCLGMILIAVLLVGGIVFGAMSVMKSSDVYKGALERARKSPEATGMLGQPIVDGWFVKGNVNVSGAGGNANLEIPVSGPKKSGTIYVRAIYESGAWMYERLELVADGGEKVSLLKVEVEGDVEGTPWGDAGETDDSTDADDDDVVAPVVSSQETKTISGGVLNGKATSKPQPPYPAVARAARAQGLVTVQVTVDEKGNVVSASAVSGHPLLRAAAEAAARQAKLSPTLLSGKPVRVTGVLTYNFVLEPAAP